MRGIACTMVMLGHVGNPLVKGIVDYQTSIFAPFVVPQGFQWVWLFLMLSGLLLTKAFVSGRFSLTSEGIRTFYWNRVRRLLPLIWFLMGLWFVFYICGLWPQELPKFNLVRELSIALALPWVPYWPETSAIASMNSPIWAVIIILHFSIMTPFLLIVIKSWKWLLTLIVLWFAGISLMATLVALFGTPQIFPRIYETHFYNFGFFATGMLLAITPNKTFAKAIPWPVILITAVLGIGIVQYMAFYDINETLAFSPLILCPVLALLVTRADSQYQIRLPTSISQMWGGISPLSWLERIGVMSFSLYLAHKPIAYLLISWLRLDKFVDDYISYIIALLIITLIIMGISVILFLGVENPFRMKRGDVR